MHYRNGTTLLNLLKRKDKKAESETGCYDITLEIDNFQGIGKRRQQEDSFYMANYNDTEKIKEKGFLAVVADGMGGMMNGAEMSAVVTVAAKEYYDNRLGNQMGEESRELKSMLFFMDDRAKKLQQQCQEEESGSTLLAVLIRDNRMHFLSVGDSRIYLLRDGNMYQLNREHNMKSRLIEKVAKEELELEVYQDMTGKSGLTAYIGMEEPDLYDVSVRPFLLEKEDVILMVSDGVFGTISEEQMRIILESNEDGVGKRMRDAVEQEANPKQDNYTGIVIKCK